MEIKYMTRCKAFIAGVLIQPQYIVVHSTAVGMTSRMTLFNAWNSQSYNVSCHGMVDAEGCTLTMPLNIKAWHVGGKGNGISVGFEICEPKSIAYADKYHTCIDTEKYDPRDPAILADFRKRWLNAVDMAAYLCSKTGLTSESVLCHAEMCRIGKATNHADVEHWFDLFGPEYGMDAFRAEVKRRLRSVRRTQGAPGILGRRRSLISKK